MAKGRGSAQCFFRFPGDIFQSSSCRPQRGRSGYLSIVSTPSSIHPPSPTRQCIEQYRTRTWSYSGNAHDANDRGETTRQAGPDNNSEQGLQTFPVHRIATKKGSTARNMRVYRLGLVNLQVLNRNSEPVMKHFC